MTDQYDFMHGNTLINVPKRPGDSMHDILRSKSAIWMQNTGKCYLGNPYQLKTNKKQNKTKQKHKKNPKEQAGEMITFITMTS